MNSKKIIVAFILIFLTAPAWAQFTEVIQTDRPAQANNPITVGKQVFQLQMGFSYGETSPSSYNFENGYVLRYGILEKLEINTTFKLRNDHLKNELVDTSFGGVNFWSAGLRYNILAGEGRAPSLGILSDIGINLVSKEYKTEFTSGKITLLHSQPLYKKLALSTNWSILWGGNSNAPQGGYVINLSHPLGQRWSAAIENYGSFNSHSFAHWWDMGINYLANNNLLLDFTAGYGNNEAVTTWFVDLGLSWRIHSRTM